MGRSRKFTREKVLHRAMPLFWKRGFSNTALQEVEKATGVNKSGLYTEFKGKDELFTASLLHYLKTRKSTVLLTKEPLGWQNIDGFFRTVVDECSGNEKGCFAVNSIQELDGLPDQAKKILNQSIDQLRQLFLKNIVAENKHKSDEIVADLLVTFFLGIASEQKLNSSKPTSIRKIKQLIKLLRSGKD
jgi:AcrR family transcriptional regulator